MRGNVNHDQTQGVDSTEPSNKLTADQTKHRNFIRTCIKSPKLPNFIAHIREAIYDAAPVDYYDGERIEDLFEGHKYNYSGSRNRPDYLQWAAEWVSRIARLTELAKPLQPALTNLCVVHPAVAWQVMYNLDRYDGPEDADALFTWASAWVLNAESNTETFIQWYATPEFQQAVKAGVWDVLQSCSDLGINDDTGHASEELVRSLCIDAWFDIAGMMDELTEPSAASTAQRLRGRARFTAMAWKSLRLEDRATHITNDEFIDLESLQQLPDEDIFTRFILTDQRKSYKRKAKPEDETAPVPTVKRRCVKCAAVLSSRNQSAESICRPCWTSTRDDASYYGVVSPNKNVCALSL